MRGGVSFAAKPLMIQTVGCVVTRPHGDIWSIPVAAPWTMTTPACNLDFRIATSVQNLMEPFLRNPRHSRPANRWSPFGAGHLNQEKTI